MYIYTHTPYRCCLFAVVGVCPCRSRNGPHRCRAGGGSSHVYMYVYIYTHTRVSYLSTLCLTAARIRPCRSRNGPHRCRAGGGSPQCTQRVGVGTQLQVRGRQAGRRHVQVQVQPAAVLYCADPMLRSAGGEIYIYVCVCE